MADPKQELERIREALAAADGTLAEALDARARATRELAALKTQNPELLVNLPRDHEVIAQHVERVRDFPKDAAAAVMTDVLSACSAVTATA